jgi:hypothetical protein
MTKCDWCGRRLPTSVSIDKDATADDTRTLCPKCRKNLGKLSPKAIEDRDRAHRRLLEGARI